MRVYLSDDVGMMKFCLSTHQGDKEKSQKERFCIRSLLLPFFSDETKKNSDKHYQLCIGMESVKGEM